MKILLKTGLIKLIIIYTYIVHHKVGGNLYPWYCHKSYNVIKFFSVRSWLKIIRNILTNYFTPAPYSKEKKMNTEEIQNLNFEDALLQLETIVRELESGRIKLDDAVAAYERAVALKQLCQSKLRAAQLKIEKIEISPDGQASVTPLDNPEE